MIIVHLLGRKSCAQVGIVNNNSMNYLGGNWKWGKCSRQKCILGDYSVFSCTILGKTRTRSQNTWLTRYPSSNEKPRDKSTLVPHFAYCVCKVLSRDSETKSPTGDILVLMWSFEIIETKLEVTVFVGPLHFPTKLHITYNSVHFTGNSCCVFKRNSGGYSLQIH